MGLQNSEPRRAGGRPVLGGELQQLVDAWAARLWRSIAIDDMDLRLLAASRHYGDEDPARIRAVLGRGLDNETADYLAASGLRFCEEPGWVTGVPELGLKTRLFVPIRCNGVTLGQLCLIDPERSLDRETIALAKQAADEAGLVLYRRLVLHEWKRKRDEGVLRDLFAADVLARQRAIREINESGLLAAAQHVIVLAIRPKDTTGEVLSAGNAIASALDRTVRTERPSTTLTMTSGHQGILLVTTALPSEIVLERLSATLVKELPSHRQFIVGVSSVMAGLAQAHTAFDQALITARAAVFLPSMGNVVRWDDLGIYAVLMRLPAEELNNQVSPPAVIRLIQHGNAGDLAHTAETFLDCAGDTGRAAKMLHVHRSTLYYRLERIEKVTGLDLSNGGDRLILHLGLKAQRLVAGSPLSSTH
ncbi:PucR family transcriptional regulator [Pseudarthrobacter cellobiosi]|uniref:PucR family transcriptional regulator n=1 Tax=Pseudarthrobacter cellobiosi TaxID=2953654 RepID=UPI00208EE416|nr:PucR family transcriptional regulator [Pseudarthrobacter sp. HLT1-5]MCO4253736.1 helix-turn-helix domain-containing protein [Pseudarthrobacter sp. HLT1-5]